jgi:hypothetical protein
VPKYTYKHADIRPWDVRNDLVQYEKDYVICTKTRHVVSWAQTAVICRRRYLSPPLFATAVICHRLHLPPPSFAAVVICHRRHLPPPSFAAAVICRCRPHFTDCQSARSSSKSTQLNMELDLQSLFGLLCFIGLAETPQLPLFPTYWGSYRRALLVSEDR